MIKTSGVYHTGIPADDLDRATRFYSEVLGMELERAIGEGGEGGARLARLKCGSDTVVLFQRPKALNRDSFKEDGIYHQAFHLPLDQYDAAVVLLKEKGVFKGTVDRPSGKTVYFTDSEGNYQELHAP